MNESHLIKRSILAGALLQLGAFCVQPLGAAGEGGLSFDTGSGINGTVKVVAVQPDGKVIIAGQFTMVRGLFRPHLERLNGDGTSDATFHAGAPADPITDGRKFFRLQSP